MRWLTPFLICAAVFFTFTPASNAGLIGTTFAGVLYDIDPATGIATNPRATALGGLVGISFAPSGELYGLTAFAGPGGNSLFLIDPETGSASLIGHTGLSRIIEGDLAIHPQTGVLYGLQDVFPAAFNRKLFRIDPETGQATVLRDAFGGLSDLSAAAFDADGNFFILNTAENLLIRLDPESGAREGLLQLRSTGPSFGTLAGMAFDPSDGRLYVASGTQFFELDTQTGQYSLIASGLPGGPFQGFSGLAFTPVPEPSTLMAGLLGLGCLVAFVRTRAMPKARGPEPK